VIMALVVVIWKVVALRTRQTRSASWGSASAHQSAQKQCHSMASIADTPFPSSNLHLALDKRWSRRQPGMRSLFTIWRPRLIDPGPCSTVRCHPAVTETVTDGRSKGFRRGRREEPPEWLRPIGKSTGSLPV
jgi:hypothetical protein